MHFTRLFSDVEYVSPQRYEPQYVLSHAAFVDVVYLVKLICDNMCTNVFSAVVSSVENNSRLVLITYCMGTFLQYVIRSEKKYECFSI